MKDDMNEKEQSEKPQLDFSGLILGFSSAALYHIGQAEIDKQKTSKPNFELAKQNIDIIRMLETKTEGNLTTSEKKLIENVLKDLGEKCQEAEKSSS